MTRGTPNFYILFCISLEQSSEQLENQGNFSMSPVKFYQTRKNAAGTESRAEAPAGA
jgi:hypothetical protein